MTARAFLAAILIGATPAFAAGGEDVDKSVPASTLDINFALYAGGIPLGKVTMSERLQGKTYKAISTLETLGIVNAFWQSKIETDATGTLTGSAVRPSLYDSYSQYRKAGRRQVTLSFGPDGPKSTISMPPYPETRYAVTSNQQKKTLDPLSGVVSLIASVPTTGQKPCDAVAPIYDGRRRYDVRLNFMRNITIRMDNGVYTGPGQMCQVHYTQVAGYQQTLIDQNKKLPPIYAWVAEVASKADPSRHYMLPLRIWAETEYGVVAAVASQLKLDGAPLSGP